ncbi:MAG: 3-dehydroquinate synthase [Pseudomonadota bacterium]
MTQEVRVDLGHRSYTIHIGEDLLSEANLISKLVAGPSALIVTNDTVGPLYLEPIKKALSDRKVDVVTLPDGEAHKTLNSFQTIMDALVDGGFARDTTVVALGGGVIGDMGGFAAATYQRGVGFLQIPTTLLSQVDSSVGGKTAVNHPKGKNLIGAFYQPGGVIADTKVLSTLDPRELKAGLAEVIKYGVALDPTFLSWLEGHMDELLSLEPSALSHAIRRSCEIKASIVKQDELEQGPRALLNFGHTFGHAIEATAGYGEWLHGEAVAAGMVMATELSRDHGWVSDQQLQRVVKLIKAAGLPTEPPRLSKSDYVAAMGLDKKNLNNQLRLILLKDLGTGFVSDTFNTELLDALLDKYLES